MSLSFGALFRLHWWGFLCPCIQKDEDRNARQALTFINESGKRILWIRTSSNSGGGGGFSLGTLFRKNSNSDGGVSGPCLARLLLQDNVNGAPEVLVDPTAVIPLARAGNGDDDTAASTTSEPGLEQRRSSSSSTAVAAAAPPSFKLKIKLSRIDKVSLDGDDIVLKARPPVAGNSNSSSSSNNNRAKELLRLRVLNAHDDCPVKQEERNMFLHHMAVLVEWERQRRAANPDEFYDDDDEDDENQPNFLQARAQKAAHFAKRELELQQTKRDREKRKAKLVAESGGLKYTALAMAASSSASAASK